MAEGSIKKLEGDMGMKRARGIVTSSQSTFNPGQAVFAGCLFSFDHFMTSRCSECRRVREGFLITIPEIFRKGGRPT